VLFYGSVVAIVAGILIAINRPGAPRSFWSGFAACGAAHMLLVFHPGLENGFPSLHPAAFVTTWFSGFTYGKMKPGLTVKPIEVDPFKILSFRGRFSRERYGASTPGGDHFSFPVMVAGEDGYFRAIEGLEGPFFVLEEDFIEVSHGLWTLLLAYIGGLVSLALYRGRPARDIETADGANLRG
jgi:hypothetical protein